MEVCVTDIKLVLLPQAHFSLFRKDNAQKRIFLKMYSRTLSRINITFRWCSVHKIPMVYITPREEVAAAAAAAKPLQSCPTLCDPIDGSPPGSPVPGTLQARTLEWVAISFSNAGK